MIWLWYPIVSAGTGSASTTTITPPSVTSGAIGPVPIHPVQPIMRWYGTYPQWGWGV